MGVIIFCEHLEYTYYLRVIYTRCAKYKRKYGQYNNIITRYLYLSNQLTLFRHINCL